MPNDPTNRTLNRKAFLRLGANAAALSTVSGSIGLGLAGDANARDEPSGWASTPKVDVHHHVVPPDYVAALESIGIKPPGGVPFPIWSAREAVAAMDGFGIDVGILSLSTPGVFFGDAAKPTADSIKFSSSLARSVNMACAAAVTQYPTRFGFFACLPLPLVQAAIDEAKYSLETLAADGVVLLSNVENVYVGDPSQEPLMAYLNSVSARVFIHPNSNPLLRTLGVAAHPFLAEWPFDTTRAALNLLARGVPARYPNIKFILAHAGGTVPYLAGRMSFMVQFPNIAPFYPNGVIAELQKFYYDTALATFEYPMAAVRSLAHRTNVLFGSDYPFAPKVAVEEEMTSLALPSVLKPDERADVGYRNAMALFPGVAGKLKARLAR